MKKIKGQDLDLECDWNVIRQNDHKKGYSTLNNGRNLILLQPLVHATNLISSVGW